MRPTRIAITVGDPAGIGPEITAKACRRFGERLASGSLQLTAIGSRIAMDAATALIGMAPLPISGAGEPVSQLPVGDSSEVVRLGKVSASGGEFAYRAIERAVGLAMAGEIDAIVTGPLNKEALNLAGHRYAGHTDMLADLTHSRDSVMLLAHGNMRISHVSTHVALHDVPARLTPQRLRRVVQLTRDALVEIGIADPHIAIAALNPHAGEGGLFGREDLEITTPTIAALNSEGFRVSGPVPGDTVFVKLRGGAYDAVVAMYHDQGHIPIKLLGFDVDPATGEWKSLSGVNITLGLPIIRTSVDHGTAFDIAGKGIASEDSLVEAIEFAERLAEGRRRAA